MNTAFREYATRIGFNLSLSKNQIAALEAMSHQILFQRTFGRPAPCGEEGLSSYPSAMIVAGRKISAMGLVTYMDPTGMVPKWSRCPWGFTPAGEAVWVLLLEAGLVRKPVFNSKQVAA